MKTIILTKAINWLIPVFILFSLYILFRGHNHPGGGFIGGLISSIAFIFYVMVHGPSKTAYNFFTVNFYLVQRRPGQNRIHHLLRMLIIWPRKKIPTQDDTNEWMEFVFNIEPVYIGAAGLLLAALSGLPGLVGELPYLSAFWADFSIPVFGKPGTPILFDAGVYLLVLGIVLKMTFVMAEE